MRRILAAVYYASGYWKDSFKGKVAILTYHRVLPGKQALEQFIQPGLYVQNDVFEMQMSFLKRKFQILSFPELLHIWNEKEMNPERRYCAITFDDGWLDNYLYAYPILQKFQIPTTIFLPTAFIGTKQWFWPDQLSYLLKKNGFSSNGYGRTGTELDNLPGRMASKHIDSIIEKFKKLTDDEISFRIEKMKKEWGVDIPKIRKLLNWEEIQEMSKGGISFGSHSSHHRILTLLGEEDIKNEMKDSFQMLREKDLNTVPVFCYPNGNYNKKIAAKAREMGYMAAVSTQFGLETSTPENLFGIKRINIHNDISFTKSLLCFYLSGIHKILEKPV